MDIWTLFGILCAIGAIVGIALALRLPPKHRHEH